MVSTACSAQSKGNYFRLESGLELEQAPVQVEFSIPYTVLYFISLQNSRAPLAARCKNFCICRSLALACEQVPHTHLALLPLHEC